MLCINHWHISAFHTHSNPTHLVLLPVQPLPHAVLHSRTSRIREGSGDKTMTQRSHALQRLLLPLLPGPLEGLGKDVYAGYKRFKDMCWILRDEAQHEINADLGAGSSTAALHIEQCFLGQVEEG